MRKGLLAFGLAGLVAGGSYFVGSKQEKIMGREIDIQTKLCIKGKVKEFHKKDIEGHKFVLRTKKGNYNIFLKKTF